MTRITNDDYKPPLLDEEALEHYGVKGMKWGVRRDQRSLDRAAGRTPRTKSAQARKAVRDAGGTPYSGGGKKSAWNAARSSADIKKARAKVKEANNKLMKLEDQRDQAKTPAERARLTKEFEKASAEFDRSHHRVVAAQMTTGGAAATGALALVVTPVGVIGASAIALGAMSAKYANSQRIANQRGNLLDADFMKGKSNKQILDMNLESIKKAARS
jgi:hypothetical protein